MEQRDSQLPAADATLDAATLDRIDPIVALGVTINPADNNYGEQVSHWNAASAWNRVDRRESPGIRSGRSHDKHVRRCCKCCTYSAQFFCIAPRRSGVESP
jgi:hypothetical protein